MFGKKKVIIECPLSHEVRTATRKNRETKIFKVFTEVIDNIDRFLFESLTNEESYERAYAVTCDIKNYIAIEVYTLFSSYYSKKGYRTNFDYESGFHKNKAIFKLEWDSS